MMYELTLVTEDDAPIEISEELPTGRIIRGHYNKEDKKYYVTFFRNNYGVETELDKISFDIERGKIYMIYTSEDNPNFIYVDTIYSRESFDNGLLGGAQDE